MTYTFLNGNKIAGTTSCKMNNCVETPFKPYSENIAIWDGEKFVYNYSAEENKEVEKKGLYDTVSSIASIINDTANYHSGTKTRKHNGEISVLIPCYNKSKYLMTAVKSCLKQTQKPVDISVLLMDCDSYKLENELIELGVTVYKEKRMNVCKARTYLAEKCKTEWLIFLDADDFLLRDYIEKLDKYDSAFIMASQIFLTEKELMFDERDFSSYHNKLERVTQQNMTALMHKDVFFEYGLNDKFCKGGEDFDFLFRMATDGKWKFEFTSETHFVYCSSIAGSLTKSKEFYETFIKVLISNKDRICKIIEDSDFVNKNLLQIYWYIKNPTEENLQTLSIKMAINGYNNYSELDFFEDYILNKVRKLEYESKIRNTENIFNEADYYFIDCEENPVSLQNRTFDVIFPHIRILNIKDILNLELPMIIKKDIYKEIKEKNLSNIDTFIYLLKNYSCFIKEYENCFTRTRFIDDELVSQLDNISFDEKIKESAQIIKNGICESMFLLNPPTQKTIVSFVLHKNCNRHCDYCFQEHKKNISDEQMLENFSKALAYVKEKLGINYRLQILGGEPTLWSDSLQEKICNLLSEYKNVYMFTNGYNKQSPLYKDKHIKKILHLVNWQEELRNDYNYDEYPIIVMTEEDTKDLSLLSNYSGTPVFITPCRHENPKYNLSIEGIRKVAKLPCLQTVRKTHFKKFISDYDQIGLDNIHTNCRNSEKRIIEIDCETLTARPCCVSKKEYSLFKFDFNTKPLESDCNNCYFVS